MKKSLKIFLGIFIPIVALLITAFSTYFIITAGTNLQPEKLIDYTKSIAVFDDNGNKIEDAAIENKRSSVQIESLSDDTVNAFIASEDRKFFSHNGLNYKRMAKALIKNMKSRSFKEGASTISQQLIKNTHLNSDKTIKRKLKEIKLTKQLERRYDKKQILEMYLNTIYFGHNCFGLQNAANFYFNKPADDLSLTESAALVGLLTSPNNYSPFKNPEKCIARRNTVLKNMLDCSFIDVQTYENAVNMPLEVTQGSAKNGKSAYLNAVFDEFEDLNIDPYGRFSKLNIKTYMNGAAQKILENQKSECDISLFLRNTEGGVIAFSSTIGNAKRQIGSTAKPIFVYAPALNDKKLDIFTKICDEPINYGGYSPENFDKKYHGNVSVADSIKYSYNIPAVKTLNTMNFDDIEKYAAKMGVKLSGGDKNLSLALGAMNEGLTLKELCDAYSVFPCGGNYIGSRFIKEVSDQNGNILYKNSQTPSQVFSQGTCSLINDVLCQTAKSGTAKRLKNLSFDVACKTGTCGNAEGNTDAYSVAYTPDYCLGVWLGDKNNKRLKITGGKDCCNYTAEILQNLCGSGDKNLETNAGTEIIEIDREDYEESGRILLCDLHSPKLNKLKVKVLSDNMPKEQSTKFTSPTIKKPSISVTNNNVTIALCQTKYYSYLVKRQNDVIYDGKWTGKVTDKPIDGDYVYSVIPYYFDGENTFYGNEIKLKKVIIRSLKSDEKIPDIVYKDWYNQ